MSTGELDYRFVVYSPTGPLLRTIQRDETTMRSTGFWARLSPEGDGQEANFTARGGQRDGAGTLDKPNWGIPCLSAVQIQYNLLGEWVPIYYGQVRQGGNGLDVLGENYFLRSLALRLGAVTLSPGFSTPKQAAHLTIRAMIQDVVNSGQLGNPTLILYDAAKIPDLGFDCRAITNANQQTPAALLTSIVQQGMGSSPAVDVRFGVGPDRKFYCQLARADTVTLTADDVRAQVWKPPVAETPCTRVLWFVARKPDNDWVTHESKRMDNDPYGVWVKHLSVQSGIQPLKVAAGTVSGANGTFIGGYSGYEALTDKNLLTQLTLEGGNDTDTVTLTVTLTEPAAMLTLNVDFKGTTLGDTTRYLEINDPVNARTVRLNAADYGSARLGGLLGYINNVQVFSGPVLWPAGTTIKAVTTPDTSQAVGSRRGVVQALEIRPETPDAVLLNNLAKYHYDIPDAEPSAIALKQFMSPAGLSGRVSYGTYTRAVTAWEYRVDAARGMELTAQAGQPDDPIKAAQASLIRARDGAAVIEALTAQR